LINGANHQVELVRADMRGDLLLIPVEEILHRETDRAHFALFDLYFSDDGDGLGRQIGCDRERVGGALREVVERDVEPALVGGSAGQARPGYGDGGLFRHRLRVCPHLTLPSFGLPAALALVRHTGDTVNAVDLPELVVVDAGEWRRWLSTHGADSPGVWLVLAKKGTVDPTSISYDEALAEAICFGWIDGQLGRRDAATFRRRFTPRKARSPWSQRNAAIAERLMATGRMHRSGEDEVQQAKEDGRWEAAYAGPASIEVPDDLLAALSADPRAQAMFETLTSANRYAILYRIGNAKKSETRSRRIAQFVEMLARGETIHPQAP
jgi:uncharacterized protein YdeI (YjbR/CyaY-like superfamily)